MSARERFGLAHVEHRSVWNGNGWSRNVGHGPATLSIGAGSVNRENR
jgi:hypothetical protein